MVHPVSSGDDEVVTWSNSCPLEFYGFHPVSPFHSGVSFVVGEVDDAGECLYSHSVFSILAYPWFHINGASMAMPEQVCFDASPGVVIIYFWFHAEVPKCSDAALDVNGSFGESFHDGPSFVEG